MAIAAHFARHRSQHDCFGERFWLTAVVVLERIS
jgi:hypothetical protein